MSYQSVDALQKALATTIFSNRQDVKKAAGRALGTIVELITFYIIKEWGLLRNLSIERGLAEFANDAITHNVEFGVHTVLQSEKILINYKGPLTSSKIIKYLTQNNIGIFPNSGFDWFPKSNQLLSASNVLRNACTIIESADQILVANLLSHQSGESTVCLSLLKTNPFAIVECKRVGVEEGMNKGPTTIEKAKQGAYVAKHVSSLQKIRGRDGRMYGAMPKLDGTFEVRELSAEINRLVYAADKKELDGFILTVGVVSNHGNWFTSDDPNKELLVLKQSYDWLLFLTDPAIGEFVEDTILSSNPEMIPVREAFAESYASGLSGKNQFTKVKIGKAANDVLDVYFKRHISRIEENWFNVLAPSGLSVHKLKEQLNTLSKKL